MIKWFKNRKNRRFKQKFKESELYWNKEFHGIFNKEIAIAIAKELKYMYSKTEDSNFCGISKEFNKLLRLK